jgi:hypothetical protein
MLHRTTSREVERLLSLLRREVNPRQVHQKERREAQRALTRKVWARTSQPRVKRRRCIRPEAQRPDSLTSPRARTRRPTQRRRTRMTQLLSNPRKSLVLTCGMLETMWSRSERRKVSLTNKQWREPEKSGRDLVRRRERSMWTWKRRTRKDLSNKLRNSKRKAGSLWMMDQNLPSMRRSQRRQEEVRAPERMRWRSPQRRRVSPRTERVVNPRRRKMMMRLTMKKRLKMMDLRRVNEKKRRVFLLN